MEYREEQYSFEEIPDFALQPARTAQERLQPPAPEISATEATQSPKPQPQEEAVGTDAPPEVQATEEPAEAEAAEEPAETRMPGPPPVKPALPLKISPVGDAAVTDTIRLVDFQKKETAEIRIEEDILVPDSKPDMSAILHVDGRSRLDQPQIYSGGEGLRFLKATGDIMLQVLYASDNPDDSSTLISIDTKVPFREDVEVNAAPESELEITPSIGAIEYSVINERKFRVKILLLLEIREYRTRELTFFEDVPGEELYLKKEMASLTNVILRKREPLEFRETLELKDGAPEIGEILAFDVRIGDIYRQISREKAVLSAPVYYSILYRAKEDPFSEEDLQENVLFQGKTEFTQFISLEEEETGPFPEDFRVFSRISDLSVEPQEDGAGSMNRIQLSMDMETGIEIYDRLQRQVVTDLYHKEKEVQYDTVQQELTNLAGIGQAEATAREVVNLPAGGRDIGQVVYLSGKPRISKSSVEAGKDVTEGQVLVQAICTTADRKGFFNLQQALPFRCVVNISGATPGMEPINEVTLKDLWHDRINTQQLEFNALVSVSASLTDRENLPLLKNLSFAESSEDGEKPPGIVLYMTRPGDDLWTVAKKYRSDPASIEKNNSIPGDEAFPPGSKVLVVR